MNDPVSALRNLGPAVEAACLRAGIPDAPALRDLGADAAYAALMAHGTRPHFIGYIAIAMALQDRPWMKCQGAEKAALRQRFDALKAAAAARTGIDAALDAIGVRKP